MVKERNLHGKQKKITVKESSLHGKQKKYGKESSLHRKQNKIRKCSRVSILYLPLSKSNFHLFKQIGEKKC